MIQVKNQHIVTNVTLVSSYFFQKAYGLIKLIFKEVPIYSELRII